MEALRIEWLYINTPFPFKLLETRCGQLLLLWYLISGMR